MVSRHICGRLLFIPTNDANKHNETTRATSPRCLNGEAVSASSLPSVRRHLRPASVYMRNMRIKLERRTLVSQT